MVEQSLRSKLRIYKKKAYEIESYLTKSPGEWGKFQAEFNYEVNNIFRDIMNFERENFSSGQEEKVYKLKKIFINRIRELFLKGAYNEWSLRKPLGYAGDFRIIDDIYLNNPKTTGFARLFDNYFQMSAISVAVRNRKDDFKRLITDFIGSYKSRPIRIMNLASGPCRELKEILSTDSSIVNFVAFDCYDHDNNAIQYAKNLLKGFSSVNFINHNAVRFALKKDITTLVKTRYDFIYSTGLFDYFNKRLAVGLVRNLRNILKTDGNMAIATVRDKYSNPSVHYMEWVGEWNLVYRDDNEFRDIFLEAGFRENELEIYYEQQGIIQYIIATNKAKQLNK